jgi:peptide/nickel transport system permease protein
VTATSLRPAADEARPEIRRGVAPALFGSIEGKVGGTLFVIMLAVAVLGPVFAPYSPTQLSTGPLLSGPSSAHLLGTDELGRDVFSRFLWGGRTVLLVPVAAVTISYLVGGGLGLLGAYRRDAVDTVLVRVFDILLSLPILLIALVVIGAAGTSTPVLLVVVAVVFIPRVGRIVRGAGQAVVSEDYVAAAEARGESTFRIVWAEILPNAAGPIIATYSLSLTYGIIFVATLSFLGLGAQPPSSEWGLMVAQSQEFIAVNPWATVAPAVGIALFCIAFTLIGDAVTRYLNRENLSLPPQST